MGAGTQRVHDSPVGSPDGGGAGAARTRPWVVVPAMLALAYAIAVVIAAWRAPGKGFVVFTGHRVVDVEAGGPAARAGLREGDEIVAIDGVAVTSTIDYSARLLTRRPGEAVVLTVRRAAGAATATGAAPTIGTETAAAGTVRVTVTLERSPPPWGALVATALAAVLLVLGLIARIGRAGDRAAHKFHATTVVYALIYVGALSWPQLVVHPGLAAVFVLALFAAPPIALDAALVFAEPLERRDRRLRAMAYGASIVMSAGCAIALAIAVLDYRAGRATDRALVWVVGFVAAQLTFVVAQAAAGLSAQVRALRRASGPTRAQLRWIVAGSVAGLAPAVVAVPVAIADLDRFLLVRYQPFVVAIAVLWFLSNGLAVLRVRLADVELLVRSSLGYAVTTGAVAGVYLAVVLGIGVAAEELGGGPWPHLAAGLAAAALFGPIRARVGAALDRRFFRDRRHYVAALREVAEALAIVREPDELARQATERVVAAVRADGGALYLRGEEAAGGQGGGDDRGTHGDDDRAKRDGATRGGGDPIWQRRSVAGAGDFGPTRAAGDPVPTDGVAVTIGPAEAAQGVLVLARRRSGDLYSSEDRHLLAALAGQLAVALANARAFGTIAAMSRSLEAQNAEIQGLRDRLEDENRYLRARIAAGTEGVELVGTSKAAEELRRTIERAARSDATVLLQGESGTGKGLIARTLHAASPRASAPFLHVDCGAIAAAVFESELFGHERGAFTGATRLRRGPVELADGGTLFLDEIGELPLELQPKLLRVLEAREVVRVGGVVPVAVDVRIVAATHRHLADMVAAGRFREDLYFRLRVVEIGVPPLRARKADLPALCAALLPRAARRCGREVRPLAEDALARLAGYGWPGNVRELGNVLERALVLGDGPAITAAELELPDRPPLPAELRDEARADGVDGGGEELRHDEVMEEIEKKRLVAALRATGGNQSHAARALGMPRTTFINKLRRHGLTP